MLLTILIVGFIAYMAITRTKDTAMVAGSTVKLAAKFVATGATLTMEAREINKETDGLLLGEEGESIAAASERNADIVDDAVGTKTLRLDSYERRGIASPVNKSQLADLK